MTVSVMAMAWLLAGSMLHGQFAPPDEGALAFRRDRLPIDVATMSDISRQLVAWAAPHPLDTPEDRRDATRMLALATALDPQNRVAGERLETLQDGRGVPAATEAPPAGTARLWQTIAWLELPEAGDHGHTLAALLLDVAAVADPSHPRAGGHAGESDAWAGWIPPVEAFSPRPVEQEDSAIAETETTTPARTSGPPLPQATVRTVIWQGTGSTWAPAVVPLQMSARQRETGLEWSQSLRIGPRSIIDRPDRLSRDILRLLWARGERIPENMRINITSPEYEQALTASMPRPISAAAAVLASAAVTGREPDALIIGEVDSTGRLSLPGNFWRMLGALESGGGKLVLPAAAADWLPSILAMDKARFFFDYEVLLARDFEHMLSLSAKQPDEEISAVTALFAEISSRAEGGDVRNFLVNRFVRQRLAELAQRAPWHASAVMLHTQSAGNRPATLSRPVLAAELRMAIRPMASISSVARREFIERVFSEEEVKSLGEIHNSCREDIDRLGNLAGRTDQDLYQGARAVAASLRTLERTTRTRGLAESVMRNTRRDLRSFAAEYDALETKLLEEERAGFQK